MARKSEPLEWIDVNGPVEVPDCQRCFAYLCRMPAEAIASVGIEKPDGIDIRVLVDHYHANGHREGSDG